MAKSTTWRQNFLDLLFLNTTASLIGDATGLVGSTVAGSLYVSLHTADPSAGDQTTNEATYTSYARVAVARSGAGWVRASNVMSNVALVTFPACTAGGDVLTYYGIGTAAAGAGKLLEAGLLTSPITISVTNPTPQAAIGAITTTET